MTEGTSDALLPYQKCGLPDTLSHYEGEKEGPSEREAEVVTAVRWA